MKINTFLVLAFVTALAVAPVGGQTPELASEARPDPALDSIAEDLPLPASLAQVELARSRRCVPLLARLDELNEELAPLRARAERLTRLLDAVALEDTLRAAPFATDDPIERAVVEWFASDQNLARRFLAIGDTALQSQRAEGRDAILTRVREAGNAAAGEAEAMVTATGDLLESADSCLGVMLVRSAVIEACEGMESVLCAEVRGGTPSGRYRLIDAPEDLWGIETLRPWTQPARLGLTVRGTLVGASINAGATRGNVAVVVGIEPIVEDRNAAPADDVARLQASLDSLGFSFAHPRFLLVPGLAIRLEVRAALGGESYYFLHFGDLTNPAEDVIWSASAATGAPLAYLAPIRKPVLDRLVAGEPMNLTAVRFPQQGVMEGEAVYTIELPVAGQAAAVGRLIEYLSGGAMQSDFTSLAPPAPTGD